MKLKLFVWDSENTLTDYTSGLICVLAEDLDQALRLIKEKQHWAAGHFDTADYKVITEPEAFLCWGGG